MLPETVLVNLKFTFLKISLDTPTPHCNVQVAIRTLRRKLPKLDVFFFSTEYDIDHLVSETSLADPTEFDKHFEWADEIIYLLQELVSEEGSSLRALATFHIACALYCLRDPDAEDEDVPNAIYAICDHPDEETFKLDGINLKFMGTDELGFELKAVRDRNACVPVFPFADDSRDEE